MDFPLCKVAYVKEVIKKNQNKPKSHTALHCWWDEGGQGWRAELLGVRAHRAGESSSLTIQVMEAGASKLTSGQHGPTLFKVATFWWKWLLTDWRTFMF